MKILIGSDHAGFETKNALRDFIAAKGLEVEDMGSKALNLEDNYPEILTPLALRIAEKPEKYKGIVLGKSGQGEAMICNRFPGVRAIVYTGGNLEIVKLGREDNDANVLALGTEFVSLEEAKRAVDVWLETAFSDNPKYARRNEMLDEIG